MTDVAQLVFDIDSTAARTAATDLAKVNQAAVELAGEVSKTDRVLRRANGQFASSSQVADKYGNEIRNLAREFNPALNAVYEFQAAEERLNKAVALGVLSLEQKGAALSMVKSRISATAQAQLNFGKATQVSTHHATNLGYQLNDIGMMMSMGQNPFMLMMQQGPQVAQIFSTMTAEGKKIGPTLISAFKLLLNPTTAVTLALIGGTAALVQWAMASDDADKKAKDFESALGDLSSATSNVNAATKMLASDGLKDVQSAYGAVNDEVIRSIKLLAEAAIFKEMDRIRIASAALRDEMTGGWITSDVDDVRIMFGETNDRARDILNTMQQIKGAKTFEDQARYAAKLRDDLISGGRTLADFDGKAREAVIKIIEMADEAERLSVQVERAEKMANELSPSFYSAARAASAITDELNRAINAAAKLASAGISDVRRAQIELDFRTDPIKKAAALAAAQFDEEVGKNVGLDQRTFNALRSQTIKAAEDVARLNAEREKLDKADREADRNSKSGGGAAARELKAAEKGFQTIRELLEKESVFQIAEWEKRQAQLDAALAKNLVSEENYALMKQQLQMTYFGLEYEQKQVQYQMDLDALNSAKEQQLLTEEQFLMRRRDLQHQYYSEAIGISQNSASQQLSQMSADFAQMNSLAGGGYNSLLKAQKTFAAGSALINAYLAATQAMADPTVPYWGKIAAYAKVLAAGMGAVNAIKGGGSGGGSSAAATSSAGRAEPTRNILVRLEGPDFMVDMAESIMTQIYEQSNDGRVVIQRDNS